MIAGLERHIEIAELQDKDLDRLTALRETRISHEGATSGSNPTESALPANMIATEPAPHLVDHESTVLRDRCEMLSRMLHDAQTQRDLAWSALAVAQQELSQQLIEGQIKTEVLVQKAAQEQRERDIIEAQIETEVLGQKAAREQRERDKQWEARCEKIKCEYEERLNHKLGAAKEDWDLERTATREEWTNRLKRDLESVVAEWKTRLKMREAELKSQYQKEMGHIEAEAQWRARVEEERKPLEQELIAARETIRLFNDASAVEITGRRALERQLEDGRAREQIQPELMKAFLLVEAIERQASQATSSQHPSEISTPLSLTDFSKKLSIEEGPNSSIAGDAKRRRLS